MNWLAINRLFGLAVLFGVDLLSGWLEEGLTVYVDDIPLRVDSYDLFTADGGTVRIIGTRQKVLLRRFLSFDITFEFRPLVLDALLARSDGGYRPREVYFRSNHRWENVAREFDPATDCAQLIRRWSGIADWTDRRILRRQGIDGELRLTRMVDSAFSTGFSLTVRDLPLAPSNGPTDSPPLYLKGSLNVSLEPEPRPDDSRSALDPGHLRPGRQLIY